MPDLRYAINQASIDEIALHLQACAPYFVSPLNLRVDIQSYAQKIVANAMRFEAWSGATLVGLVAMYCNGAIHGQAYITNVSVLPDWGGQGVAGALMTQCLAHAKGIRLHQVKLEVEAANVAAIRLYAKNGFTPTDASQSAVKMKLDLPPEEHHG